MDAIAGLVRDACNHGARALFLGEMAITGMVNNDYPDHDLPLGEKIPGPYTCSLASMAKELKIWLAIGLLEREGNKLFDTAMLLSPSGTVVNKQRRINPNWHGNQADPEVYCQGLGLEKAETGFGTICSLICGDFWDDGLRGKVRRLKPDWLYHPFGRCLPDENASIDSWWDKEIEEYSRLVMETGVPTLGVSYLSQKDVSPEITTVGGAMAFDGEGKLLTILMPGQTGMAFLDL